MVSGRAWNQFCDTLKAAGASLGFPGAPQDAFNQAEGYRYLTRLTRAGLMAFVEHADPKAPVPHRVAHETVKLGAGNPGNHYQTAAVAVRRGLRGASDRNRVCPQLPWWVSLSPARQDAAMKGSHPMADSPPTDRDQSEEVKPYAWAAWLESLSWWEFILFMVIPVAFLGWFFSGSPYVQRFVFDNPTCRGFRADIELMVEDNLRQQVAIASQLGISISMPDIELSNVRRVAQDASTGRLTCLAKSSAYNSADNTVDEDEIRYTISSRADGKDGYYLRWQVVPETE